MNFICNTFTTFSLRQCFIYLGMALWLSACGGGGGDDGGGGTPPADTTPELFSFIDQADVALSSVISSNSVTISGINAAAAISVTGGEYAIDGGTFLSAAATINNGQTVVVRLTSSASNVTQTNAALTVGGVSDTFSVTTLEGVVQKDIIPDAFTFADQTGVALSSVINSNSITISGINEAAPISITGGDYAIDGGVFTSTAGTVNNAQSVVVRLSSSANNSMQSDATLTVGGVTDTFSVTTLDDTDPDAFSFTAQTDVAQNTVVSSNSITVAGINAAAPISLSGGEYAIDGGAFTNAAGSVNNGQSVVVRQTSSVNGSAQTDAVLTIGSISAVFSVTTLDDITPDAFTFVDQTEVEFTTFIVSNSVTISGVSVVVPVSISGGEYSIDGGAFTSAAGTINNGQSVRVRLSSSANYATQGDATLTVSNVSDTFSITTTKWEATFLFPNPGANVGRGYATTTSVVVQPKNHLNAGSTYTSVSVNGVSLTQSTLNSQVWHGQIPVTAGSNTLNVAFDSPDAIGTVNRAITIQNDGALRMPKGLAIDEANNKLYVVDSAHDALLSVNLANGAREIISDFQLGTGGAFSWPRLMRFDSANNRVLLVDRWLKMLLSVNLLTGDRTVVASSISAPLGVELHPTQNTALVANSVLSDVKSVLLSDGTVSTIASNSIGTGDSLSWPADIAVNANNEFVVLTSRAHGLLDFDPDTGNRSYISNNAGVGSGDLFSGDPVAVKWQPDNQSLWVVDGSGVLDINSTNGQRTRITSTDYNVLGGLEYESATNRLLLSDHTEGAIKAFDTGTNLMTTLSDGGIGEGSHFNNARSIAYDADTDTIYVGDYGVVYRVDAKNGDREILAQGGLINRTIDEIVLDKPNNRLIVLRSTDDFVEILLGTTGTVRALSTGSEVDLTGTDGFAFDATNNFLYVAKYDTPAIVKVDLNTGVRSILSDNTHGTGEAFAQPWNVRINPLNNHLLVIDENKIISVNPADGNRTLLSDATGGSWEFYGRELTVDADKQRVLVVAKAEKRVHPYTPPQAIVAVSLTDGAITMVSSPLEKGSGPTLRGLEGIEVDAKNHRVFGIESLDGLKSLLSISELTGDRVIISQ